MSKVNKITFRNLIFLISHFSCFILFSCTAPIEIDTGNSEPVIVINGTLTDEYKQQEIRISRSSPYFDDQPNTIVSGAIVKITTSSGNSYHLIENDSIAGLYQTSTKWSAQAGVSYFLSVEIDFDSDGVADIYEASTTIIAPIQLDSIKIIPMNIMGHKNYALNVYAMDSPEHDYYLCKFLVNDTLISTKISRYYTIDDIIFNGQYVNGAILRYFDNIDNRETDTDEQRKNSDYLSPGDKVELEMSRISKGYHNFINQCQKEMNGENPFFGGPASNITTNINNGGVGYFAGYCIMKANTVVPH